MNLISAMRRSLEKRTYRFFEDVILGGTYKSRRPFDYERVAYAIAAKESADFLLEHMYEARNLRSKSALLEFAIKSVRLTGQWLEFGVYKGADITVIADHAPGTVYGFDSFEGLPEDWTFSQKKGRFSLDGMVPAGMPKNVELIKGWFDDTLPAFLESHPDPVAFLHIDSDLYTSAKTVLTLLESRIVRGTIILFDDFINYPEWKNGESKAFFEFIEATHRKYSYIGFASAHHSVAIEML